MIADAEPEQAFELAAERLDVAFSGLGIAVQALENVQRGAARRSMERIYAGTFG